MAMTRQQKIEYCREYNKKHYSLQKAREYFERTRIPIKSYIYIISNPAWNGYVKIGRAKDVERRLIQYQTGSPFRDYVVLFEMQVDDILDVERFIYNKYEMENEWCVANWTDVRDDLINYTTQKKQNQL